MSLKNLYENMPSEEILRRMKVEDFSTHCRMEKELNDPVIFPMASAFFISVGFGQAAATFAAAVATAIVTTSLSRGVQRREE